MKPITWILALLLAVPVCADTYQMGPYTVSFDMGVPTNFTEFPKLETFTFYGTPETRYSGKYELENNGSFYIYLSEYQTDFDQDLDLLGDRMNDTIEMLESQMGFSIPIHKSISRPMGDPPIMGRLVVGSFLYELYYTAAYPLDNRTLCKIVAFIQWDNGASKLFNTIHIDRT
jgi:hypothetical protein